MHQCPTSPSFGCLSRREFLALAASAAGVPVARGADPIETPKLMMPKGRRRSRVVRVQAPNVVAGQTVHPTLLTEMLDIALNALIPAARTAAEAWPEIVGSAETIGIKFNRSGQEVLGTTPVFADVLIQSIIEAGWDPSRVVCIEAPAETAARWKTALPAPGYSSTEIDFGSGRDQFAAVLSQIDALINVPFLKTHNIAGVTCALKNLSHGLVKHPARFHAGRCSPFIADIVNSEPIRSKLRVCIVDALRVVFDGGPDASVDTMSNEGLLLVSTDPVAVDTIGVLSVNETRRRNGLPRLVQSPADLDYLAEAHRKGLGIAIPQGIDVVDVEPG